MGTLLKLKKDAAWYIKMPGASSLYCYKILEVTEKTVLLAEISWGIVSAIHRRYRVRDLDFVEEAQH